MTTLSLRRAKVRRQGRNPDHGNFDVFDCDRKVGRIYLINARRWFWGVRLQLTGRKSYGTAASLDEAKAAFKVEYDRWRASACPSS